MNLINLLEYDENLFSGMVLPAGMDNQTMVNAILLEDGTLTPVYSDPSLFKQMIGHYFQSRLSIHTRIWNALHLEYNPIENYDRKEDSTRTTSDSTSGSSTGTGNGTDVSQVSPFNTGDFANDSKSTNSTSSSATNSEESSGSDVYTSRVHGNIGVTTSQQMIQSEIDLAMYDIYRRIAADFSRTFFIQVY